MTTARRHVRTRPVPPRRPPSTLARVLVREQETGRTFHVQLFAAETYHRALLHGLRSLATTQPPPLDPRRLP